MASPTNGSGPARHPGRAARAVFHLPLGVIRLALVVRVVDEWWSYLPAGAIGDLRRDLGVSYSQAGWLLALLTVGGLVGSPLAALADRGYRRPMAVTGTAVLAGGLVVYALGAPFWALAVASSVLGAASDLTVRPLESSLADLADADLDRALGTQHVFTWLGDFIGPAVLALGAATALGWRGAFALTAVGIAGYGVVIAMTEFPQPTPADDDEPSLWRSALALARTPEVLLLSGAEFIMLPLDEAFLGFAIARRVHDSPNAVAQLLAGGIVIGGLTGAVLVSREGLMPARVRLAAGMLAGGALVVAALPYLATQVGGMVALGFGTAIVWAKVHHRQLTVVPGRSATVPTVVNVLSTPAVAVPVLVGVLADRVSLTAGLIACASLAVPLAIIVLRLGGGPVVPEDLADDD